MKKNKKSLIPAVIICVLALFAVIGIRSFLGPCVHEDGTFGPCRKAGQALFWVSIVLLAEGVLAVLVNKSGVRKGLFIAILLTGIVRKESILSSLSGGILGIGLAAICLFAFATLIESKLGLPYLAPDFSVVLVTALAALLSVTLIGALSCAWTAKRLSRIDPGIVLRGN